MKIGRYQISLAKQKAPANTSGREQGADTGLTPAGYFDGETGLGRIKTPSINHIMRMLDNDGTAAGLYNVITFPVLATPWHIKPDPQDVVTDKEGNEIHPQADFVEHALRDPLHKGGMSTPFSLVLADIMLGIAQGYRIFEIVYKLNDEGLIVFQKIVARDHDQVKILRDDTGGFAGFEQKIYRNSKSETITIELPYSFLFTHKKDRNKLTGKSAFIPAFYHYDKKHRLYYLANQQAQVAAIGNKVLKSPSQSKRKARDANLRAVDRMAVRSSIALPFGWDLDIKDASKNLNMLPYIDHQDVQMARSLVAQGMLQGNGSQTSGGSYSLGEVHFDMFMFGEQNLITSVEEHITSFLISKLIDYNFEKPLYPTFQFEDMSNTVLGLLEKAFESLVSKGNVPDWVADGIAEKIAEHSEIVKPEDADNSQKAALGGRPVGDTTTENSKRRNQYNSRKKKDSRLSTSEWWRELTPAESKVNFTAIQNKADTAEEAMLADIKTIIDKISDDTTARLKPLLEDKGAKALDGFELKFADELRKVMADNMIDTYGTAKTAAADEIKKKAPANKQKSKDLMTQHAQAVVDKQFGDMLFEAKTIVTDAVRKNQLAKTELSIGSVLALIAEMFGEFYTVKEPLTVASLITTAINIGRDDVFQEYESDIYAYQYSAILDDAVCPICSDLDGSTAKEAEYYATKWMPPIHFNCRCIWVAIMNDEEGEKPEITGIPDAPGGATEPSLSYQHIDENSLTATVEYQLYLNKRTEALWSLKRS